jgi:hypothetical protein
MIEKREKSPRAASFSLSRSAASGLLLLLKWRR